VVGWTATIRPPSSYTSSVKESQIIALALPDTNPADYEEDHRLPLELGGHPDDMLNLTPEKAHAAKDTAENAAKRAVCTDGRPLRQVQAEFIASWLGPWPAYAAGAS